MGKFGSFTKLPGVFSKSAIPYVFGASLQPWTINAVRGEIITNNDPDKVDFWQNGKMFTGRGCVYHSIANDAAISTMGGFRGLLKDDVRFFYKGSGVNLGDTVTIGTDTWIVIGTNMGSNAYYAMLAKAD
jgi:hypothetical protein